MEIDLFENTQSRYLYLNCDKLVSHSIMGYSFVPVTRWKEKCRKLPLKFGKQTEKHDGSVFIRAISLNPLVNVAFSQYQDQFSLTVFNLDEESQISMLEDICSNVGFNKIYLVKPFADSILFEFENDLIPTYSAAEEVASARKVNIEKSYAGYCYSDFLSYERGIEYTKAIKIGFGKFGIDMEIKKAYGEIKVVNK